MYSTRQPNSRPYQPQQTQHPRPVPATRRQEAEALFTKTRRPTPKTEEIRHQLQLPSLQRSTATSTPAAPAPVEKVLTPEQKKQLRTLYLYGMTAREAADHFGVSLRTIDNALGSFSRKRG